MGCLPFGIGILNPRADQEDHVVIRLLHCFTLSFLVSLRRQRFSHSAGSGLGGFVGSGHLAPFFSCCLNPLREVFVHHRTSAGSQGPSDQLAASANEAEREVASIVTQL
jgi:hypothetical protein